MSPNAMMGAMGMPGMPGMPMPMPNMGMPGAMGNMMGAMGGMGMGPGFPAPNAHFNPAFFGGAANAAGPAGANPAQAAGMAAQQPDNNQWNPHGAKRTRQE
ncbi:hypothetical protein KEM52_001200 [Ascosphaera acerosa]|nr:hypothetical protein KEM52_001200 [Ascosphaera acerosa]